MTLPTNPAMPVIYGGPDKKRKARSKTKPSKPTKAVRSLIKTVSGRPKRGSDR